MTNVGIVGHEKAKFDNITESIARVIIRNILLSYVQEKHTLLSTEPYEMDRFIPHIEKIMPTVVSGDCHLGGIDIWAVEEGIELGCPDPIVHTPEKLQWEPRGYRARNLKIAKDAEVVHCIVVNEYPPNYNGMRFSYCYHCETSTHIKSGACWTARKAITLYDKPAYWHIIRRPITIGENVNES